MLLARPLRGLLGRMCAPAPAVQSLARLAAFCGWLCHFSLGGRALTECAKRKAQEYSGPVVATVYF